MDKINPHLTKGNQTKGYELSTEATPPYPLSLDTGERAYTSNRSSEFLKRRVIRNTVTKAVSFLSVVEFVLTSN